MRSRLDDGLKGDREIWDHERTVLENDVANLEQALVEAKAPLDTAEAEEKQAKFELAGANSKLKGIMKGAAETAELRHKLEQKNSEAASLLARMELIKQSTQKKKKPGGKKR